MEDGAKGDIMTLLSANQPQPCCCHRFTLRGVQGGTVLFKPTVNHHQEHQLLCANASSYTLIIILITNNDDSDDNNSSSHKQKGDSHTKENATKGCLKLKCDPFTMLSCSDFCFCVFVYSKVYLYGTTSKLFSTFLWKYQVRWHGVCLAFRDGGGRVHFNSAAT